MTKGIMMELPREAKLLRIFIGESDHYHHHALYEAIVAEARKRGLAGATVLHGMMGFGKASRIHTAKILRLSEDLPVVIEIVDSAERIEAFLPDLCKMVGGALITVENIQVVAYCHESSDGAE